MKLLNLKAENIFSIGEIELPLDDRGLTLITGWSYDDKNGNMAGKSSIARNAPIWCLYGKTVDGVRADDVMNTSTNKKPSRAIIKFQGNDGNQYRVHRSRNPNFLHLYVYNPGAMQSDDPWQALTKRNEKDTQALIDKALGRGFKTFIQSDFFGQGRERSFLSLVGSEQRSVIEEILPLNSLEGWYKIAKEQRTSTQAEVDEAKLDLRMLSERMTIMTTKIQEVKDQHTNWSNTKATEMSVLQADLTRLKRIAGNTESRLADLLKDLPDDKEVPEILADQQGILEALDRRESKFEYSIEQAEESIKKREGDTAICAYCAQDLPEEQIQNNLRSLDNYRDKIKEYYQLIEQTQDRRITEKEVIEVCKQALKLQEKIEQRSGMESLEQTIAYKQAESNPFKGLMASMQAELDEEILVLKVKTATLKTKQERHDHYKFWDQAFGKDLRTVLFNQVCPYLEAKTNQYLKELNNEQIKVRFSTVREMKSGDKKDEFCVTASSDTGSNVFALFSGAEKQLTSFAVGMALSSLATLQVEGPSQFMILDEPFLYQSPENCENIVSFITQKLSTKSTILLISNEENLRSLVPNRVHIVKRNGVSSIEQG